jgi:hypothetical protein
VKEFLLVLVLAVAQQEIAVLLAVGAVVLSEAMGHLLVIAVLLEAVAVALSGVMALVVLAVIADRLDHQAVTVALAVVEMVVVATTWVGLLECQSF